MFIDSTILSWNDRMPYTYYLYHRPTGLKYYGSKYGKDADPAKFWVANGYFTSSVNIHNLIEEYGIESFDARVTRIWQTPEQALNHEYRFLTRVDAVRRSDWLNENAGGSKFYNVGPDSDETKAKKSASAVRTPESNAEKSKKMKGVAKPEGFGDKLSKAQQDRPIEKEKARRAKIREKATGRGHTEKTSTTLSTIVSNTRWIKKENEQQKVEAADLGEWLAKGWQNGRINTRVSCVVCRKTGVLYNMKRKHLIECKGEKNEF